MPTLHLGTDPGPHHQQLRRRQRCFRCQHTGRHTSKRSLSLISLSDVLQGSHGHDKAREFFGAQTYLTVSAQLHLEAIATAISRCYTIGIKATARIIFVMIHICSINFLNICRVGPTFRAENSQTARHLAEFSMVEAEAAFMVLCSILHEDLQL